MPRLNQLSRDDKQLKFLRISLLNRADEFVQALLLANKVGKVTAEEAPHFFYQAAYAHYRLGEMDMAMQSLDMALQHAVSPDDVSTLKGLRAAIDRPQMAGRAVPVTDGDIAGDYQFSCGAQSGESVRCGYSSSSNGASGVFLRLLQLGEI